MVPFLSKSENKIFKLMYLACLHSITWMKVNSTDRPWHLTLEWMGMTVSKSEARGF